MAEEKLAEMHWYIVTTYSQHERKVLNNLQKRIESMNLGDRIKQIIIAEEEVPVLKDGVPSGKTKMKNLYPGYLFVEMIMDNETWYIVRNTPGVTGIAGSSGGGQKPTPLSREEMEPVLKRIGTIDESMISGYKVGDNVKVINGQLEGAEGKILEIDKATGACRVEIMFFGKPTAVDLEFKEIEKM